MKSWSQATVTILCIATVLWLYPPEKKELHAGRSYIDARLAELGPITAAEKRAGLLMLAAIALWMTDFIHHIPPSKIGLGARRMPSRTRPHELRTVQEN